MLVDKIKLEPDEQVLIQTRRHWFIIVSQIIAIAFIAIIPLFLLPIISAIIPASNNFHLSDYAAELTFIYCLLATFVWITIFSLWTNYYLDVLTVTDRRAILVNQKGFFWRNVASFRLERMQDLNVEINGLIATMLDYGTITVETAGHAEEEFKATHLPNPNSIKSVILQAADNRISGTKNHEHIDLA